MATEDNIVLKKGRTREQFLITEFDTIDYILNINPDVYKGNPLTLLGFYTTLKRFINRRNFSRDNEVNFKQSSLKKEMKVSNTLYYDLLKVAFNTTLLDIEKVYRVVYFINLNMPGTPNVRMEEDIVVLSSDRNINIFVEESKLSGHIAKIKGVPHECIKIVSVTNYTSYIINEFPLDEAVVDGALKVCRSWDEIMSKFNRPRPGSGAKKTSDDKQQEPASDVQNENEVIFTPGGDSAEKKEGDSAERNGGVSSEQNTGDSAEQKQNSIILLNNNITDLGNSITELLGNNITNILENSLNKNTELLNNIINSLSIYHDKAAKKKKETEKQDRKMDDDILENIFYNLKLENYHQQFADMIKFAITEMYYNPKVIKVDERDGQKIYVPHEVVKAKVKQIDNETVLYALEKYIEAVDRGTTIYVPHMYFASCIWTAIIDYKLERAQSLLDEQDTHEKTVMLRNEIKRDMAEAIGQPELIDPLVNLAQGLTEISFNTWFKSISKISINNHRLFILVPAEFNKEQIEKKYLQAIANSFSPLGITGIDIVVKSYVNDNQGYYEEYPDNSLYDN